MFVKSLLSIAALGLAAIRGPLLDQAGDPGGGGAPAGGGAPPVVDPAADPAQGDPAGAADAGAEHVDAPDLDDDAGNDDRDDEEFVNRLPEANLRTRVRRGQRYRRETEPIVNLLRGPDGKFLPPQEVNRILSNSREFEGIDRILRADPQAVKALMEAEARLRNGGPASAATEEPAFDEKAFDESWPYEIESKEGRGFFERQKADAKRNHERDAELRQIRQLVTGVQQTTAQTTFDKFASEAKTLVFKAAEELDPAYQQTFISGAKAQFDLLRHTGRLSMKAMQDVIDKMLAPVRAAKSKHTRTTASRQSAMAAGNAQLPRTPRPGTIQPASGEPTKKRETIADARKSFLSKYAG